MCSLFLLTSTRSLLRKKSAVKTTGFSNHGSQRRLDSTWRFAFGLLKKEITKSDLKVGESEMKKNIIVSTLFFSVSGGSEIWTGLAFPVNAMQVKFVSPAKIRFKEPFNINENGELIPFESAEIHFPIQNKR